MGRRSDHTLEQIRDMALDAAEKIIRKKGIRELSTRKIAAEIGYTSGTLYLVFKNLDDLFVQVNGRTLSRLKTALSDAASGSTAGTPREAVLSVCRAYLKFAEDNRAFWHLVFEHDRPYEFNMPPWYQTLIEDCFAPLLASFRALKPEQAAPEALKATQAVWAMVHGTHSLYMSGRAKAAGIAPSSDLVEYQLDIFLRGYLKE